MKKRNYNIVLCMLMCILLSVQVVAQQNNEPGAGSDLFASNTDRPAEEDQNADSPPDPQDTPIDGGLVLLLMAGTVYGIKKYMRLKQPATAGYMIASAV